ncbi:MAG: hypothetical protein HZA52_09630 [Planctomycetes bacterium]|nr:hypothetical protein [Planctomycetota bacterium]
MRIPFEPTQHGPIERLPLDSTRRLLALWALGGAFAGGVLDFAFCVPLCVFLGGAFAYPVFALATDRTRPRFAAPPATEARWRTLVRAPLVAGEARVALYFVLLAPSTWLAYMLGRASTHRPSNWFRDDDPLQLAILLTLGLLTVLTPRLFCRFAPAVQRPDILYFVMLGPSLVVVAFVVSRFASLRALDPEWLCAQVTQQGRLTRGHDELLALALACGLVVVMHVPEMFRGVRELRSPRAPKLDAPTSGAPASGPSVPSFDETRHVHP